MAQTTRTLNPLPFQDLEPHRFEDLVRQLAYDFRVWNKLEATGKSGSDQGYDARAIEAITIDEGVEEGDAEEVSEPKTEERQWLIQCKREKSITPKKMLGYADEIVKNKDLYGVIFSAACDFSKRTRDVFYEKLARSGVKEILIWGRGELEDMLVQPKNDNLLFAYFGISLRIRERTLKTQIRSTLSTKRKLVATLGEIQGDYFKEVLIRDAADESYPMKKKGKHQFRWKRYYFLEFYHSGIVLLAKKYFAYAEDNGKKWDLIPDIDQSRPHESHPDLAENESQDGKSDLARDFCTFRVKKNNQAWFEILRLLPYDNIIDVDKFGDPIYKEPHIYVTCQGRDHPFDDRVFERLVCGYSYDRREFIPKKENKVNFFPKKLPKIPQKEKDKYFEEAEKKIRGSQ